MDMTFARRHSPLQRSALFLAAALLVAPFAGVARADEPVTVDVQPVAGALPAGAYEWTPEVSPTGPLTVIVSLPAQEVHVYRGDTRIGRSSISSGRPGYDTPPGVYEILEKREVHHSKKYNNAPMPFMQRLTWDGIALHAGQIPGYPASHGCVRLPMAFAERLFEVTEKGGRVIVADASTASEAVLYPGERVPVDPWTGRERGNADTMTAGVTPATGPVLTPVDASTPALAGK